MENLDEQIEQTKKRLNELMVRKFINELTFDKIKILSVPHGVKKTLYTEIYVNVPRVNIKNKKTEKSWVKFHVCKSVEFNQLILSVGYKFKLLEKMKRLVFEKYIC